MATPRRISTRTPHRLSPLALLAPLLALAAAPAFGTRGSDELLVGADRSLAWAPAADFSHELDRIAPPGPSEFKAILPPSGMTKEKQSAEVEKAELEQALGAIEPSGGMGRRPSVLDVIAAYEKARSAVGALESANPDHLQGVLPLEKGFRFPPKQIATTDLDLPVPPGLSDEFAEHLRALADYYAGNPTAARARWLRLLDRPEARRRPRSVWATFMIGKTWLDEVAPIDMKGDPAANAVEWFHKTRDLARAGFPDPLGLAAASLGWEAFAELRQGRHRAAVELYLQSHATGDPSADVSLALMCQDWFREPHAADSPVAAVGAVGPVAPVAPDAWATLAGDPATAKVLTAYAAAEGTRFIPRPKSPAVSAWLAAVERVHAERIIGPARLALVAFQNADDASATRFLAAAPDDDPLALWLRGKLAAKAGKIDDAADLLATSAAAFSPDEVWYDVGGGGYVNGQRALQLADRVRGEWGVVELARGNYTLAMDLLQRAGWASDANYIAECLLTPEELTAYVEQHWPDGAANAVQATAQWYATRDAARDLLARRLTRLGRWKQARRYFSPNKQALLDEYVGAIREGHDADRSDDDRADSFWHAALLARERGVELFGHDTVPAGGSGTGSRYYAYTIVGDRQHPQPGTHLGASADEVKRLSTTAPRHYSRLEARDVASEHAWSAAELMPDESDETARRLCMAGNWLKNETPQAARRFFRSLIDRCGTTQLGRNAFQLGWLPAVK